MSNYINICFILMANTFQRSFIHLLQSTNSDLSGSPTTTPHPQLLPSIQLPSLTQLTQQAATSPSRQDTSLTSADDSLNGATDDTFRIVRGRTKNSQNSLYRGYRYSKDGKSSNVSGKQAWRCILRTCKGRLNSLDNKLVEVTCNHNHEPDLHDCEVRATLSHIKNLAETTRYFLLNYVPTTRH